MSGERWMVVDKHRTPLITGMFSRANAEDEAAWLNRTGLVDYQPYRVVLDVVAMDLDQ